MEEGSFGWALEQILNGLDAYRKGWMNYKYIRIQNTQMGRGMTEQFVFVEMFDGNRIPWTPDQKDMLATDWLLKE